MYVLPVRPRLQEAPIGGCALTAPPGACLSATGLKVLSDEKVDAIVAEIVAEKEAADAARRRPGQAS